MTDVVSNDNNPITRMRIDTLPTYEEKMKGSSQVEQNSRYEI